MKKPKLFYCVSYITLDGLDTKEIFDNEKEAMSYFNYKDEETFNYDLSIVEVENYYKDGKNWNYDDFSNTFRHITNLYNRTIPNKFKQQ